MHCVYCNSQLIECTCPDLKDRIASLRTSPHLVIDWDGILEANAKFRASKEPVKVRLTEDYLNLETGAGYPEGTVLVKSPHGTGQYLTEGQRLGTPCVGCFDQIKDISERIQ